MKTITLEWVEYNLTPVLKEEIPQEETKEETQEVVPSERGAFSKEWRYVNSISELKDAKIDLISVSANDKNIRPTRELAEACLAMSQLAQLRNETWRRDGDWKPDWKDSNEKFVIEICEDEIYKAWYLIVHQFLAFRTAEIRDEFLDKHRELIEKAKPLL